MPKDSLKRLLSRFPYFLDKRSTSNFSKSESVFNNRFQEVYNDLFKVYLSSKIGKCVLIWKEQTEAYNYKVHFHVGLPSIKEVKILKNDEVIYSKQYLYDEEVKTFNYIHSGHSETIIPIDKFKIMITTIDENTLIKGFPENDNILDDEFDHDQSLDHFGNLINLPRRQYQATDEYLTTEPPYNDRLTEDDYHYMNRLLFYFQHLNDVPLPVLEIWKLFAIPISKIKLLNRERLLCKMFEKERRTIDGVYNSAWIPREGEHKDEMCPGEVKEPLFFVNVNNSTPIQLQDFRFDFTILDSLGRPITDEVFYIVPFVDGRLVEDTILTSNQKWTLNTSFINHGSAKFIFKCFRFLVDAENEKNKANGVFNVNENDIVSDELLINTRGCNSADWYVDPAGDDSNDGMTRETPFRTLRKALSMVESSRNIITLSDDTHELPGNTMINQSTKIIACPGGNATITNTSTDKCFKIAKEKSLYIQNVYLNYSLHTVFVEDMTFLNNNVDDSFLNVTVDVIELISTHNANVLFEDNAEDNEEKIMIDTTSGEGKWDIIISPELHDSEKIIVKEDSDNPNIIIHNEEE